MSRIPETKFGFPGNVTRASSGTSRKKRNKLQQQQWKFSDRLSQEGRLAMQMAKEDSILNKQNEGTLNTEAAPSEINTYEIESVVTSAKNILAQSRRKRGSYDSGIGTSSQGTNNHADNTTSSNHRPNSRLSFKSVSTFSELYAQKSTARMRMDITDENFSWEKESKKPLGGGKLESTLELVEVINADEPVKDWTEEAINELARVNALDKCMVWMAANGDHQYSSDEEDV